MSGWGGKGSGWSCHLCGYGNHHSARECVDCQGQGHQQTPQHWGKGKKGKGDYPSYQGKGDHPPQGNWRQQAEKPSTQRQKLGMLRQMLKSAEKMDGWEDKAMVIREEIKEQLVLSNAEQGVTREQQGAIYLQQLQWHAKEKKGFKKAMLYHQDKTDHNAREYQKQRLEIRNLYAELEEIGWNQVLSEEDLEGDGSVDSDDATAYMSANNTTRRIIQARETPMQRSARLNLRQRGLPSVVDLTEDDGDLTMGVEPGAMPQAAQAAAPPQAAGTFQAQQAQQQPQMEGPALPEAGSVAAARMHAVQEAQELAAARSVFG
jgi:hypothetical protein